MSNAITAPTRSEYRTERSPEQLRPVSAPAPPPSAPPPPPPQPVRVLPAPIPASLRRGASVPRETSGSETQPPAGTPRSSSGKYESAAAQPTTTNGSTAASADPLAPAIQRLALSAFEILEGTRAIGQLAGWITPEVLQQLQERRAARTERRTLYQDHRRVVATPGPAHISRPSRNVVEATVVLHAAVRTSAVAVRLERSNEQWRATHLTLL